MRNETETHRQNQITRVLLHLTRNLDKPNSIRDLSRIACFAPSHFHRVFREVAGDSVHQYIRRMRLSEAAYRLIFSHERVLTIALDVGYQTNESFTRAFKGTLGWAPSEFRAVCRRSSGTLEGGRIERQLLTLAGGSAPARLDRGRNLARQVAFCTHFGPLEDVPGCWRRLHAHLQQNHIPLAHTRCIGIVYDDPMNRMHRRVRYDACILLPRELALDLQLGLQRIPEYGYLEMDWEGEYQLVMHRFWLLAVARALNSGSNGRSPFPYYECYSGFPFIDGSTHIQMQLQLPLADPVAALDHATAPAAAASCASPFVQETSVP